LPGSAPGSRWEEFANRIVCCGKAEFVGRLFAHGVLPLDTPVGGSCLNRAESLQRLLRRRAWNGQDPTDTDPIIARFEAVAGHWNATPTPLIWGGNRAARRRRQRERRHRVGGSGAQSRVPLRF
jgi:hypothetical protein